MNPSENQQILKTIEDKLIDLGIEKDEAMKYAPSVVSACRDYKISAQLHEMGRSIYGKALDDKTKLGLAKIYFQKINEGIGSNIPMGKWVDVAEAYAEKEAQIQYSEGRIDISKLMLEGIVERRFD